ncbi:MAG: bifunctional UDP-3-O-[3-hydroxymyristoyl] N-acetylglucosamine deacetylase/3-hydroxyacyl-ACP dehydratase [Flavobacteriales bacterium]|nr:bifunctional UDP-3-O-[3-hydroxymyristoyl] N-acetylglucosamine deacetylase/3-hydroxyacyl-ACP dehydratase [Flavobacteriales bacterium]MBT6013523.1 bifunctional UDP-3-O-[3-hydroxymyristoyl] N-acetylglucosamine deacetylase/3-hydroxyacyl-ACP dehydratase [Flavobacteriales bacterium]MBT7481589.1 bifunctional UDP-3-O-[3-hydroxymyristoyl] N-acetylglucosamine deacetylase/3-hydroxyacyl-ACP dehydratase [Flavobacteriales bacterium]
MMKQKTLNNKIYFSGVGIHTGVFSNITLIPAEENTGIIFRRNDLENSPEIKADVRNVISTDRSTNLGKDGVEINTVEHILAAISGTEIDNIIIEIDNIEVPIMDGSSREFIKKISEIGTKEQSSEKRFFEISKRIEYTDEQSGTEYIALPKSDFSVEVEIDYNSKILGIQQAKLNTISDFKNEISSSRTFCFLHELEQLLENNLIKGGDINNAIVIVENEIDKDKLSNLASVFGKEDIQVQKGGILNNLELRHENEAARHKLLDVVGDLTLLGRSIKGKIIAKKPGHKHNIQFTKKLQQMMNEKINKTQPEIDFSTKPLYDREKIKEILPHRDPFLFIDEIREIGNDSIVGVKHVKEEEDYFKGHFPGAPVMPGVLQLETMAQIGGVLILNTVPDPENYLTFFMKIDNAKFKRKVVPGDTIVFRLSLISPIRRGLCHMHGKGFVNEKIVVEGDLLAQIAKK